MRKREEVSITPSLGVQVMVSSLRACDVIHLASQQRTRISVSDLGTGQA